MVNLGRLRALFGRHVLRRADDQVGRGQLRVLADWFLNLGDAEVEHLSPVGCAADLFEHDVVALEIAMHDAFCVRCVERARDLSCDFHRTRETQRA